MHKIIMKQYFYEIHGSFQPYKDGDRKKRFFIIIIIQFLQKNEFRKMDHTLFIFVLKSFMTNIVKTDFVMRNKSVNFLQYFIDNSKFIKYLQ